MNTSNIKIIVTLSLLLDEKNKAGNDWDVRDFPAISIIDSTFVKFFSLRPMPNTVKNYDKISKKHANQFAKSGETATIKHICLQKIW